MKQSKQIYLFPDLDKEQIKSKDKKHARSGTFIDNLKLPIHRWFRYSAGFSAEWTEQLISKYRKDTDFNVLDPFAGSGTTLLAAEAVGIKSVGFETHPFIHRIAKAKLNWKVDTKLLRNIYRELIEIAKKKQKDSDRFNIPLLKKCFTPDNFIKLDALRQVYLNNFSDSTQINEIIWLGITSIIRSCSTAGTAQWQYVLPNKKKAKVLEPFDAFMFKMEQIIEDINYAKSRNWSNTSNILLVDARNHEYREKNRFDLVVTSPPYPNNYDYADATRLEMTFWGDIEGWKDLQPVVRQYLVRSCSQHSAAEKLILDNLIQYDILSPIYEELSKACNKLAEIRLTKGGKKTYHTMAAAYFLDLAHVFMALRPLCKKGSKICFVVGDSAPYGVYLAVDKWLGELAVSAGFRSYSFEKVRDRNIKWKNRKHNVPLHEGRLWIEG